MAAYDLKKYNNKNVYFALKVWVQLNNLMSISFVVIFIHLLLLLFFANTFHY